VNASSLLSSSSVTVICADFSFFPKSELPPSSPFPLEVGPRNTARDLGERYKLPQRGLGRSSSRQTTWCILGSKSAALVAAVFVDFPKSKCNFLHKTSLVSYVGSNSSRAGALWGVFLLGQSPPLPYGSRRLWLQRTRVLLLECSSCIAQHQLFAAPCCLKNGTAVGLPVTLLSVTSNEPMAHNTQDGSVV